MAEHPAGIAQEQFEEQVLGAGEGHPAPAPGHPGRGEVEHEVAVAELLRAGRVAAQQCAQAGAQLGERERLDQVVVGARVQPGDAVIYQVAGGEHQDRRPVAAGAQPPAHLEAVRLGHGHVEHHRVDARRCHVGQRRAAAVNGERRAGRVNAVITAERADPLQRAVCGARADAQPGGEHAYQRWPGQAVTGLGSEHRVHNPLGGRGRDPGRCGESRDARGGVPAIPLRSDQPGLQPVRAEVGRRGQPGQPGSRGGLGGVGVAGLRLAGAGGARPRCCWLAGR